MRTLKAMVDPSIIGAVVKNLALDKIDVAADASGHLELLLRGSRVGSTVATIVETALGAGGFSLDVSEDVSAHTTVEMAGAFTPIHQEQDMEVSPPFWRRFKTSPQEEDNPS